MKRKKEAYSIKPGKKEKREGAGFKYDFSAYKRPNLSNTGGSVVFQLISIDYHITSAVEGLPGILNGQVPVIRLYGVNENGNSVHVNVHGFLPYLIIRSPDGFDEDDCVPFMEALQKEMSVNKDSQDEIVIRVDIIKGRSIQGYSDGPDEDFIRVTVRKPMNIPPLRQMLEDGITIQNLFFKFNTFESNILFPLRFMINTDLVGGGWVEVKTGKYNDISNTTRKNSRCQLELDVHYENISAIPCIGNWSKNAPLRILSFDIECAGRMGVFPQPQLDPVIQIACYCTTFGESTYMKRNIFNLKSCGSINDADVFCFDDEFDLLEQFAEFFRVYDPDVIIGYNICNFDFPYLDKRAKQLGCVMFSFLSRVASEKMRVRDTVFGSKAYGKRESQEAVIEGRVVLDILMSIQREHKLRHYTLNAVSAHFLGEQKEDVHHSQITRLHEESIVTRTRLAVYCLKDAYLPQRLLDKLMLMYNLVEMARITGVPLDYILSKGQQIKTVSLIYREAKLVSNYIPYYVHKKGIDDDYCDDSYEGATVLEAKKAYYDTPIVILDFSSLYPSIMQSCNMCYTTLIEKSNIHKYDSSNYTTTPNGDSFMKESVKMGILPIILTRFLEERKKVKNQMKKFDARELNPSETSTRAVLDGRQLAIKISANSIYGFTGATVGKLPCIEISGGVTAWGRDMIDFTKKIVEERYPKTDKFGEADVIYGDTDSVMIKRLNATVGEMLAFGKEAAAIVTGALNEKFGNKYAALLVEKVYFPFLLINKKRYAGLLWTKPDKYDKIDAKGIETVRRDNCLLVKNTIQGALDRLLIHSDVEGAKNFVKKMVSDLYQGEIDISLLVITKGLTKKSEDYVNKQTHVELAEKMRKRDPSTAPHMGDRVPYVMIKGPKKSKGYENSEDPLYALKNNLPIDLMYYVENQLEKPIVRIFGAIMTNPHSLLKGEHTRAIHIPSCQGPMAKFTHKLLCCMLCKTVLKGEEKTLCKGCYTIEKEQEVYSNKLSNLKLKEELFSKYWTACQDCIKDRNVPVICSSRECPIFYARETSKHNAEIAADEVDRFSNDW